MTRRRPWRCATTPRRRRSSRCAAEPCVSTRSAEMKVRIRRVFARDTISWSVLVLLATASLASGGELADAAMNGHRDVVRALLQKHVDVNAPQADGTTALHWAVRRDDVEMADLLIRAGARVAAVNRDGATPMQLAALNGNASMLEL